MEKIKNLAKNILYHSRYYHLIRFWDELIHPRGKLILLTYHNISDGSEYQDKAPHPFKLRPVITTQQFQLHLRILKNSYNVVSVEEGVKWLKGEKRLKHKMAVITFDDGYESFYTLAFPLLRKYDFPATMFLPTDFINQNEIFWWDKLNQIFFHFDPETPPPFQLIPIIGEKLANDFSVCRNTLKQKVRFLQSLESWLASLADEEREERIESLGGLLLEKNGLEFKAERTLNWEQINLMSKHKITFGSHTSSHLNLRHASLERIEEEIEKSKREIESHLNTKVTSFAYPYGLDIESYKSMIPILKAHNFYCALTALWGFNDQDSDPFLLRRAHIGWYNQEALVRREMILNLIGKRT